MSFFANQPQQQPANTGGAANAFSFTQTFKHIQAQPQQRFGLVTYDDVMDDEMNPTNTNFSSNYSAPAAQSSFFSKQPTSVGSFSFGGSQSLISGSMDTKFTDASKSPANTNKLNSILYTEMDKLSEEDRVLFEADRFIDRIPLSPPPRELCLPVQIRSH